MQLLFNHWVLSVQGTLFVLAKDVPLTEQLTASIAAGNEVQTQQLVDQLVDEGRGIPRPARSDLVEGQWRLIWSTQVRATTETAASPMDDL